MEEKGCWTKFLSVVLPFVCLVPYGFWGRNKILVYALVNNVGVGELLVYDLDSNSARQLKVENISGSTDNLPIFYKENLNSLIDKNGIQDYDARSVEALEFLGYKGPNTTISGSSFRRDPLTGDKIIFREDGSYYMNSDR